MPYNVIRNQGTITVTPRNEAKQSALVVILHGLGDTAEGFVDVAEHLAEAMPYCKFIIPTAPTQPVTMNMGMSMPSWYDITGLDERSNEKCKGIEESRNRIAHILKSQHEESGLPYSRMALMGFSQGGALSLFTGLGLLSDQRLAGIVVMSGYLPALSKFKLTNGLESTPIFHGHGTADPLVLFGMATKTSEALSSFGLTKYKLKPYEGMQHTVIQQEIMDVLEFLTQNLPDDESCRVAVKDPSEMSMKELRAAIKSAGLSRQSVGFCEKIEFVNLLKEWRAKN